jgi:SAM-dependent methyltransferase
MTAEPTHDRDAEAVADREFKAGVRGMWALGDYDRFSELVWEVGPVVVAAAGVRRGERVLDVAAGTGNTPIRAAEAGADVVASDLTPENFESGRRNAARSGVEIEWVEADAEALPFEDAEFDVVTSSFGAMFAPRHERVADELVRVCKPGGRMVMANFTPEGLLTDFFDVFSPHIPAPREGDLPPAPWGREEDVRCLFDSKVSSLEDDTPVVHRARRKSRRLLRARQGDFRAGRRHLQKPCRPAQRRGGTGRSFPLLREERQSGTGGRACRARVRVSPRRREEVRDHHDRLVHADISNRNPFE